MGGTFTLETASQNLPFEYAMSEDDTLHFWEELVRPERILDEPLTEDPDYFWLAPQRARWWWTASNSQIPLAWTASCSPTRLW